MNIDPDAPARSRAETTTAAPPETTWQVLADIGSWSDWNPDVTSVRLEGPLAPGTVFRWKAGGARIRSRIEAVDPPTALTWSGRSLGLRARHTWRLTPTADGGTHVVTEESLSGLPARLFSGRVQSMLDRSLQTVVAALRAEAERRHGPAT